MRYRSDSTWIRRHLLQKSFHNNFAKLVLLTLLLLLPWYANRQGGEDLNWRWWHMGLCASFSWYIWSFSHHGPRTNNSFNNSLLRPRCAVRSPGQVSSFWAPLGLCQTNGMEGRRRIKVHTYIFHSAHDALLANLSIKGWVSGAMCVAKGTAWSMPSIWSTWLQLR